MLISYNFSDLYEYACFGLTKNVITTAVMLKKILGKMCFFFFLSSPSEFKQLDNTEGEIKNVVNLLSAEICKRNTYKYMYVCVCVCV